MATSGGKRGGPKGKGKKPSGPASKYSFEIFLGFVIFAIGGLIVLLSSGVIKDESEEPAPVVLKHAQPEPDKQKLLPFEEPYTYDDETPHKIIPPRPSAGGEPRIAIIIDDMGQEMQSAEALLALDAPITFAILPHQRFSEKVARNAGEKGRVVMLHLPMQPSTNAVSPGTGALLVTQSEDEIVKLIDGDIQSVPGASGVNNHMGSKFTEDEARMQTALKQIKKHGLFFVDSRTSPKSVGYKDASKLEMPVAARDVFLDNDRDVAKIESQIEKLVQIARKRGFAIGIGHPYHETIAALKATVPALKSRGIKIVAVTELLSNGKQTVKK